MYNFMYKFMYGFMYNFMYNFMYKFMYKFMCNFMCKCLGSGPGPRPQCELGQDWHQGPTAPTEALGPGWIPCICT